MWLCQEVSHWKIRWRNEAVDILSEISQQHEHFFIIASLMFNLLDKSFASFFNWEISKKEKFYKECFLLPWWLGKCSELYVFIKLCINKQSNKKVSLIHCIVRISLTCTVNAIDCTVCWNYNWRTLMYLFSLHCGCSNLVCDLKQDGCLCMTCDTRSVFLLGPAVTAPGAAPLQPPGLQHKHRAPRVAQKWHLPPAVE